MNDIPQEDIRKEIGKVFYADAFQGIELLPDLVDKRKNMKFKTQMEILWWLSCGWIISVVVFLIWGSIQDDIQIACCALFGAFPCLLWVMYCITHEGL